MKIILLVVLAVSAACAFDPSSSSLDFAQTIVRKLGFGPRNKESRIIGGNFAWNTLLPYQAAVTIGRWNGNIEVCGGTLIGNEWVMTAAHCIDGINEYIEIGLGSVYRDKPLYKTFAYEAYISGNWNSSNYDGDIGLLKFPWVDYNERIAPAVLPARSGEYPSYLNYNVTASGWGGTNAQSELTNYLKYAVMRVAENSICSEAFGSDWGRPDVVCVATLDGQSTCFGDSGGPLVIEGTQTVIGITSFANLGGCTLGYPIGFTRVTSYLYWIYMISGI